MASSFCRNDLIYIQIWYHIITFLFGVVLKSWFFHHTITSYNGYCVNALDNPTTLWHDQKQNGQFIQRMLPDSPMEENKVFSENLNVPTFTPNAFSNVSTTVITLWPGRRTPIVLECPFKNSEINTTNYEWNKDGTILESSFLLRYGMTVSSDGSLSIKLPNIPNQLLSPLSGTYSCFVYYNNYKILGPRYKLTQIDIGPILNPNKFLNITSNINQMLKNDADTSSSVLYPIYCMVDVKTQIPIQTFITSSNINDGETSDDFHILDSLITIKWYEKTLHEPDHLPINNIYDLNFISSKRPQFITSTDNIYYHYKVNMDKSNTLGGILFVPSISHKTYACHIEFQGKIVKSTGINIPSSLSIPYTDLTPPRFLVRPNDIKLYMHESNIKPLLISFLRVNMYKKQVLHHQISLACQVTGNPAPNIIWLKNGLELHVYRIDQNNNYSGVINTSKYVSFEDISNSLSVLYVNHIDVHDSGIYTCRASNTEDSIDATAMVKIFTAPVLLHKPPNIITLGPKEDALLNCIAIGNPRPQITWYKNGKPITPLVSDTTDVIRESQNYVNIDNRINPFYLTQYYQQMFASHFNDTILAGINYLIEHTVSSRLHILGAVPNDAGIYQCMVHDKRDDRYTIEDSIIFRDQALTHVVYKINTNVTRANELKSYNGPQMSLHRVVNHNTPILTLLKSTSDTVLLQWSVPLFIQNLCISYGRVGSSSNTLKSIANHTELSGQVWIKHLEPDTEYSFQLSGMDEKSEKLLLMNLNTTRVINKTPKLISNLVSHSPSSLPTFVDEQPIPTNLKAWPTSSTSIKITWEPPVMSNAPDEQKYIYTVYIKKLGSALAYYYFLSMNKRKMLMQKYQQHLQKQRYGHGNFETRKIFDALESSSGSSTKKGYRYKRTSFDMLYNQNRGEGGQLASIDTDNGQINHFPLMGSPPSNPTLDYFDATPNRFGTSGENVNYYDGGEELLNGGENGNSLNPASAIRDPTTEHPSLPLGESSFDAEEEMINVRALWYHPMNLVPFSYYSVRVEAHILDPYYGNRFYTPPFTSSNYQSDITSIRSHKQAKVIVRTLSDVPGAPPNNITITALTATRALVRWLPPSINQLNGILTGYKVRYKNLQNGADRGVHTTDARENNILLNELKPGQRYSIRVSAITINGSGVPSDWLHVTMPLIDLDESRAPDSPSSLTLTPVKSGTNIIVSWTHPSNRHILVRGYTLGYGIGVPDIFSRVLPPTSTNFTLVDLQPNSEYVVSLRAFNNQGNGQERLETIKTFSRHRKTDNTFDQDLKNLYENSRAMEEDILLPPIGVKALTISDASIEISWSDAESHTSSQNNAITIVYTVKYNQVMPSLTLSYLEDTFNLQNRRRVNMVNVTNQNFVIVDDLKPNTQYEFAVKMTLVEAFVSPHSYPNDGTNADTKIKQSTWSLSTFNTTSEAAPTSPPRDLTIFGLDDDETDQLLTNDNHNKYMVSTEYHTTSSHITSIYNKIHYNSQRKRTYKCCGVFVNWQPPKLSNGKITGYIIYYTTQANRPDRDWAVESVKGHQLTSFINDLTPDTSYHFKILAVNSKGYGPLSPVVYYKTPKARRIMQTKKFNKPSAGSFIVKNKNSITFNDINDNSLGQSYQAPTKYSFFNNPANNFVLYLVCGVIGIVLLLILLIGILLTVIKKRKTKAQRDSYSKSAESTNLYSIDGSNTLKQPLHKNLLGAPTNDYYYGASTITGVYDDYEIENQTIKSASHSENRPNVPKRRFDTRENEQRSLCSTTNNSKLRSSSPTTGSIQQGYQHESNSISTNTQSSRHPLLSKANNNNRTDEHMRKDAFANINPTHKLFSKLNTLGQYLSSQNNTTQSPNNLNGISGGGSLRLHNHNTGKMIRDKRFLTNFSGNQGGVDIISPTCGEDLTPNLHNESLTLSRLHESIDELYSHQNGTNKNNHKLSNNNHNNKGIAVRPPSLLFFRTDSRGCLFDQLDSVSTAAMNNGVSLENSKNSAIPNQHEHHGHNCEWHHRGNEKTNLTCCCTNDNQKLLSNYQPPSYVKSDGSTCYCESSITNSACCCPATHPNDVNFNNEKNQQCCNLVPKNMENNNSDTLGRKFQDYSKSTNTNPKGLHCSTCNYHSIKNDESLVYYSHNNHASNCLSHACEQHQTGNVNSCDRTLVNGNNIGPPTNQSHSDYASGTESWSLVGASINTNSQQNSEYFRTVSHECSNNGHALPTKFYCPSQSNICNNKINTCNNSAKCMDNVCNNCCERMGERHEDHLCNMELKSITSSSNQSKCGHHKHTCLCEHSPNHSNLLTKSPATRFKYKNRLCYDSTVDDTESSILLPPFLPPPPSLLTPLVLPKDPQQSKSPKLNENGNCRKQTFLPMKSFQMPLPPSPLLKKSTQDVSKKDKPSNSDIMTMLKSNEELNAEMKNLDEMINGIK